MGIDAEMFVVISSPLSAADVHMLGWELCEAFGASTFWVNPNGSGWRSLEIVDKNRHGIPLVEGEQLLEARPMSRFYGVDYERGDLPLLITLADWLELRIPGGRIWYGGDSGGAFMEPFDKDARAALFAHFAARGHLGYEGDPRIGGSRFDLGHDDGIVTPDCPFDRLPMRRTGWGKDYARFSCPGCDHKTQTHDGGKTWTDPNGHAAKITELERQLNWHREQLSKLVGAPRSESSETERT